VAALNAQGGVLGGADTIRPETQVDRGRIGR